MTFEGNKAKKQSDSKITNYSNQQSFSYKLSKILINFISFQNNEIDTALKGSSF